LFPEYKTSLINNQPIIGVLTQPSAWPKIYDPSEFSYLAASYIKFLEQSGARVLPLRYNLPENQLAKLFSAINGLVIPGGGADLFNKNNKEKKENNPILNEFTQFSKTVKYLISLALKANEEGEYFPIFAISLGFETMISTIANDMQILDSFNSTNHSNNLKFQKVLFSFYLKGQLYE
jgi:gamma-glutamyl hydrolase